MNDYREDTSSSHQKVLFIQIFEAQNESTRELGIEAFYLGPLGVQHQGRIKMVDNKLHLMPRMDECFNIEVYADGSCSQKGHHKGNSLIIWSLTPFNE